MKKTIISMMLVLIIVVLGGALFYQYTELNSIKTENLELKEKVSAFEIGIEVERETAQSFYETLNEDIIIPSEEFGYTLEQLLDSNYSIEPVQEEISIISSYLSSFKMLTEEVENTLNEEKKNAIGNMDWAVQNIGFYNRQLRLNISVYELDLIIKKLDFEAAIAKFRLNEMDTMTVEQKKEAYLQAKLSFENYISNVRFSD